MKIFILFLNFVLFTTVFAEVGVNNLPLDMSLSRTDPSMRSDEIKNETDERFLDKTLQLLEIVVNIKRLDDAKEIQKRALEYFPNQKIRNALPASKQE